MDPAIRPGNSRRRYKNEHDGYDVKFNQGANGGELKLNSIY